MSDDKKERYDNLFVATLKTYRKKLVRSIFKINPLFYMLRWQTRRENVGDIQAVLTAELNSFKLLDKDKKIHIAIKILKVTNQW